MPRQALPGGWREMWLAPGCCASLGALAAHGWSIAAAGAETHTGFTRPLKPEPHNSLGICRGYLSSPSACSTFTGKHPSCLPLGTATDCGHPSGLGRATALAYGQTISRKNPGAHLRRGEVRRIQQGVIKRTPNFISSAKCFAWLGKRQGPASGEQPGAG